MKILFKTSILCLLLCLVSSSSFASHVAGGALKYTYIGKGSTPGTFKYKIQLTILRDCNGIAYTTPTERVTAVCRPFNTNVTYITLNKTNYIAKPGERPANNGNRDVSDVCRGKQSRCAGTGNPGGYEELLYEGFVELPNCNYWEIILGQTVCCRNGMANANGSTSSPYIQIHDSLNSSSKSSTHARPVQLACTGQDINYTPGIFDPDGDSLSYLMVRARTSTALNGSVSYVNYTNPYTYQVPISNFKMDSATGMMSFRTNSTGKYLVAFEVSEYDRCTKKLKGRTYYEMQFDVRNCSNSIPYSVSGMSNLKGNALDLGNNTIQVCVGEQISWTDTIYDPDLLDTLYFTTNSGDILPKSSWKVTSLQRNKAVVEFNWKATHDKSPYKNFFLVFDDDRCDFPGKGATQYRIIVSPGISAGNNQTICKGDTATLTPEGGRSLTWKAISGDSLIPNQNWFNVNGKYRFVPSKTTQLVVKADTLEDLCGRISSNTCSKYDTIAITVVDSFSLSITPSRQICYPGNGELTVTPSRNFAYSYKWSPAEYLNNDSIINPTYQNLFTDKTFEVEVTSAAGCNRMARTQLSLSNPFPDSNKAFVSDSLVCLNKSIDFWTELGEVKYPQTCQVSSHPCQGTNKDYTLGTGANTNASNQNNFPGAYNTMNKGYKNQYLYLASDLKSLGIKAGPISSIAWEIQSIDTNSRTSLSGYSIKMGCSPDSNLSQYNFEVGLKTVYYPKNYSIQAGWNEHQFDQSYIWDGTSNIVVQVCYHDSILDSLNHIQTFENRRYHASNSFHNNDSTPTVCSQSTPHLNTSTRLLPRTRFGACEGLRKSALTFDWHPKSNGGFVGSTNRDSANANVNLGTAKNYFVVISDSAFGVCKDTLRVKVNVVNTYSVTPSVNNPYCIHDNSTRFTAPTPYNTPGIRGKWTGVGIVNDTLGIWDLKKSGIGTHWVKYAVTGNACANEDSTQVEIFGNPDVSILSPDSLCLIYNDTARHKLIPKEPGGWFSGLGVDSVINSSGGTTYYFDAQLFKQQSSRTDSAHITYARTKGCHADTTIAIPLVKPWDHTFLGVLENGIPYPTTSFCQSDSMPDTLAVVGKNPVWFIQTDSTAMIDQNRGILDPTVVGAGKTSDVLRRITVGNYGFCGTDTTFTALFVKAPEIEVLGRIYCPDYINDPANRTKVDTVLFRIPKGPTLAGATGKKTLDPNGFDSTSEVNAYYGDVALTGWPQSYGGGVPNQFLYNYWDGKPWMTFPNVARYRLSNLKQGKNRIIYQYAFKYRDNHPTQFACISRDTAYIEKSDCVGIEEFDANQLQIYPNPAQDKVYLIWTNYSGHNIDVKLFDIRGKMVFENSLSQHEITQGVEFDISSIPPGSYFINLSSDKTSKKVKLIIQ